MRQETVINPEKKRCPICGALLEKYPNNGQPLTKEKVCLNCNNNIIVPLRFFTNHYKDYGSAMIIRNRKIRYVSPRGKKFTEKDLEVILGDEIEIGLAKQAPFGNDLVLTMATLKIDWDKVIEGKSKSFYDWLYEKLKKHPYVTFMIIPSNLIDFNVSNNKENRK